MASAWRRKRRFGELRGRVARRSCASDRAMSRWPARTAASVKVQSTTSRCAWLPPICHRSKRTGSSNSTAWLDRDSAIAAWISAKTRHFPRAPALLDLPLGGLFSGQFLAADRLRGRQIILDELPHDRGGDALVIVAQYVADARDLRPRYLRMPGLELIRQMTACLRDDFNAAFHQPALAPIGLEGVDRNARHLAVEVLDR